MNSLSKAGAWSISRVHSSMTPMVLGSTTLTSSNLSVPLWSSYSMYANRSFSGVYTGGSRPGWLAEPARLLLAAGPPRECALASKRPRIAGYSLPAQGNACKEGIGSFSGNALLDIWVLIACIRHGMQGRHWQLQWQCTLGHLGNACKEGIGSFSGNALLDIWVDGEFRVGAAKDARKMASHQLPYEQNPAQDGLPGSLQANVEERKRSLPAQEATACDKGKARLMPLFVGEAQQEQSQTLLMTKAEQKQCRCSFIQARPKQSHSLLVSHGTGKDKGVLVMAAGAC
eukprot:1161804-Pelagomonas_calceolata.AAC.4